MIRMVQVAESRTCHLREWLALAGSPGVAAKGKGEQQILRCAKDDN